MKKSTTIAVTTAAVVTALTVVAGGTSLLSKNKVGSYNPLNWKVASRWNSGKYSEAKDVAETPAELKEHVKKATEFVKSKAATEFKYRGLEGYPALTQLMNDMDAMTKAAEGNKGEEIAAEGNKDEEIAAEGNKDEEIAAEENKGEEEVVVNEEKKDK